MKKSFFGFALTLVMAFGIASCGKSGGGGGGGTGISLLTAGGASQNTTQTVANFTQWSAGPESYQSNQCGDVKVTRVTSALGSNNANCSEKSFLGIKFYVCSSNYNNTNNNGTSSESTVNVRCGSSVISSSLSSALSGTIVEAYQSQSMYGGQVYTLRFSTGVTHVIDTAFPAAFQPMHTTNADGSVVNLTRYQILGTNQVWP